MNGRFITLEGIEGAGKSTAAAWLAEQLNAQDIAVTRTREPGGSQLAEAIRGLLLDDQHDGMSDMTELLLMFAARAAHLRDTVLPALDRGEWVICDRFTDASYAYQGAGRGVPSEHIQALENMVQGELRPDRVVIFDLPVEIGLSRARSRGDENRFESETVAFFERVRECYLNRAKEQPARYRVIDASAAIEDVRCALLDAVIDMQTHRT